MTKPIQKIKKLWEDKTGVSPIIAVILMVAITVVLAATIYVWVSGFGGGGDETPNMACRYDAVDDRLEVISADNDILWDDITIQVSDTALTATETKSGGGTTDGLYVEAGDYVACSDTNGATTQDVYTVKLVYEPTNSQIGSWTITC